MVRPFHTGEETVGSGNATCEQVLNAKLAVIAILHLRMSYKQCHVFFLWFGIQILIGKSKCNTKYDTIKEDTFKI